ncbi:MAG: amidohydrolase family protein [Thermoleophilia bacterium]|jgi:cytosine/adenosine deaminase-related metal-dependent hydrolase
MKAGAASLLEADWVLPISAPPIPRGAVWVVGGQIAAVAPAGALRAQVDPATTIRSFPGSVLMPGLVNAHTHLEYSAFRDFSSASTFPVWMLRLLLARRKLTSDDYATSARWGAYESVCAGTTCVADISFEGWTTLQAAAEVGLRGRVYIELFGLADTKIPAVMGLAEERLSEFTAKTTPLLDVGLSPHAPYTVSALLYREVARYAHERGLHITTHLGESPAEVEMLVRGRGSIAGVYKVARLWSRADRAVPGLRPAAYLASLGVLSPRMLAAHCVQTDEDEVTVLASTGAAVAHCPRSNDYLRCGTAPVAELRAGGVHVGLGTDSLASNDSLDMFSEMRAALVLSEARGRNGVLTAGEVLRMATVEGARALGLDDLVGSLEVGKRADLIVVRLPGAGDGTELGRATSPDTTAEACGIEERLVSSAGAADVQLTMVDGHILFDRENPNKADRPGLDQAFAAVRARLGLDDTPRLMGERL